MSNRNSDRLSKRKSASTSSHTTKDTEIPRPSTSSSHEQSSSGKGKDKEEEEAGVNQQQASGLPGSSVARSAPATTESIRRSDDATIDIFPTQDVSSGHIRAIPGSSSLHWPVNQFDLPESLAAFLQQSQQHDLPLRQQGEEYSTFGQDIRQARSQGDSRRTLQVSQSMPEIINTDLSMQSGPMLRDADISHSDDALRRLPPVSMTAAEYLAYHESPEESMVTSSGSMLQESPGYPTSAGQFDEANMFEMTSPILSSLPHRQLPNQHQVTAWFLPASTQAIYPSQQIVTSPSSYYGGTPAFPSNTFLTPMAAAFAHEYSEQPFASSSSLPSSTLPTTTFPSSSSSASPPLAPPQFPPSISPTSQWPSTEVIPACDLCRKRKVKCDRQQPTCGFCARQGVRCTTEDQLRKRGPPTRAQKIEMKEAGYIYDRSKRRWRRMTGDDEMFELDLATEESEGQQPPKQRPRQGSLPNNSSPPSALPILKHSKSDSG